jgi:serine/threonine-protein kinase
MVNRLGEGGMSVVWRAHDEVLDRMVAIKLLAAGQRVDAAARIRVQAEARAAAALAHPNVATVHDYGQVPGPSGEPVPYVVMELVDGVSLTDVLADGPVDPGDAMRICADVASGLAAAHARGLVHRDIKPGNVIVTAAGAKLVDFGLAAAIGEPDEADEDGIMFGTPAYLAPERLENGVVVPGSDVYALGLLLYRMIAGTTPWSVQTTTQMLKAHAYLPPEPLPSIDGIPAEVADLCQRCLAKDPADRPTAAQVATVLTSAAGGPARPRPPTPGPARPATPNRRMRRRRLAVLAALVAVLVTVLFLILPRLFGPSSGQRGSPDPGSGIGGLPAPGTASLPATANGSGIAASPDGRAPGAGPAAQDASGTNPGIGAPGAPPAGTATPPAGGGTGPPAGPGNTATPDPARRTVDTTGGSAVVECAGKNAHLISWTPAAGYETQAVQPGPGPSVQVKFRSGNTHVSIQAKCVNGIPDVSVR